MREDELLEWLRGRLERRGWTRVGDDAAELPEGRYVTTVDTQIAGVHFTEDLEPRLLARRLLAVNLSDLAAMGAEPAYAFLALSAPPTFAFKPFFSALIEACARASVELAGGDLSSQPRCTAVLTLLGRPAGRVLRRSGGGPGHALWIGGPIGESALGCRLVARGARLRSGRVTLPSGLSGRPAAEAAARRAVRRHLEPRPQLELGRWLAGAEEGAAMDVSDGLGRDLHRLCRASGTGAEIEAEALRPPRDLEPLLEELGLRWLDLALGGGEDYVLLFSLPAGDEPPRELGCRRLGRLVAGDEIRLVRAGDGRAWPLPPAGFDHLVA
ncbi:MAG: thiamine-phosphate kinase, partial [Acidobacteriota bacterium]